MLLLSIFMMSRLSIKGTIGIGTQRYLLNQYVLFSILLNRELSLRNERTTWRRQMPKTRHSWISTRFESSSDFNRSMHTYNRSEEEVNAERDAEAGQICSIKQACFALLFSNNVASSIGMSRAVWKETDIPSYDYLEGSVLVFRLANNWEIFVQDEMVNHCDY